MSVRNLLVVSVLLLAGQASGLAAMSVDLGSEWMKVAVVSVRIFDQFSVNFTAWFSLILQFSYFCAIYNPHFFSLVFPWKLR